jgi:putative nucleotidyltransferase with HDIG domain
MFDTCARTEVPSMAEASAGSPCAPDRPELLATLPGGTAARALLDQLGRHHVASLAHSRRVARVLLAICGAAPERFPDPGTVLLAGLLHDVGKLEVPAATLGSGGALSQAEFALVRRHPEAGAELLQELGFAAAVVAAARDHHERWDGRGYPAGRPGALLDPLSRALAVADSFVAMVEPGRAYRAPLDQAAALAEIARCRGTQFEPAAADLLLNAVAAGEPVFALATA